MNTRMKEEEKKKKSTTKKRSFHSISPPDDDEKKKRIEKAEAEAETFIKDNLKKVCLSDELRKIKSDNPPNCYYCLECKTTHAIYLQTPKDSINRTHVRYKDASVHYRTNDEYIRDVMEYRMELSNKLNVIDVLAEEYFRALEAGELYISDGSDPLADLEELSEEEAENLGIRDLL